MEVAGAIHATGALRRHATLLELHFVPEVPSRRAYASTLASAFDRTRNARPRT